MKKWLKSITYRRFNATRAKTHFKRKQKSALKKKGKRRSNQGKPRAVVSGLSNLNGYTTITAPRVFSLLKNPEQTIQFINKLESLYLHRKKAFVNIEKIEDLDYTAVTVLVSVMFSFKSRKIPFNGNFPEKGHLKQLLIDSDFFKYLNRPISESLEYSVGKRNQIFTRANKEVNSELGLAIMDEASQTIWGQRRICKGLQRTLLELMQNTNNHADKTRKGVKHWWVSVNHDRATKKVSFVFVDYGIGIFESLRSKPADNKWFGWWEKIQRRLIHGGNEEIMRLLLNGEMHLTVTGQHFRGKGLPGIKEVYDRNQISSLHLISNNVYANVDSDSYAQLTNQFSGTLVYWEINETNHNLPWTISQ